VWRQASALACIAFLHGLVYWILLPHWMGEDEPWQLENVILVSDGYGLPSDYEFTEKDQALAPLSQLQAKRRFRGASLETIGAVEHGILESMRDKGFWRRVDWVGRDDSVESFDEIEVGITAAHHPPLYYFVTAPLLWLFPQAEPRFQLLLVRTFSLFLFVITVLLTFAAARRIFTKGPGALLAALLVALWPMSARGAAVVNNDVLTRVWVALSFYVACYWTTREEPEGASWRVRLWPPLALLVISALALFTKTSGASTVAIVALATLLHPASLRRMRGTVLTLLGLGAVAAAGAAAWLSTHNPGVTLSVESNLERLRTGLSLKSLGALRDTIVGRFNWEGRGLSPDVAPAWGVFVLVVLALSLIAFVWRRDWLRQRLMWLAWGTALVQILLMAVRGVTKGRYLMPVAPALAVLVVAGLFVLIPARWQRSVAVGFVLLLMAFDGFFVWHGLGRAAWLEWRW